MKATFLIIFLSISFNCESNCQSNGDINGVWEVNFEGSLRFDSIFITDSFGNRTNELSSIDTTRIEEIRIGKKIWMFENHELKIKTEKLPGRYYTREFQYKFLESGLLITSKSNQFKYYIEQIENDKLVLINKQDNSEPNRIELLKK
jgi:hypothetical protein